MPAGSYWLLFQPPFIYLMSVSSLFRGEMLQMLTFPSTHTHHIKNASIWNYIWQRWWWRCRWNYYYSMHDILVFGTRTATTHKSNLRGVSCATFPLWRNFQQFTDKRCSRFIDRSTIWILITFREHFSCLSNRLFFPHINLKPHSNTLLLLCGLLAWNLLWFFSFFF